MALLAFSPTCRQNEICPTLPYCDYRCFILPCISSPDPYVPTSIQRKDACYPPIAYILISALSSDAGEDWCPSNGEVRLLILFFLAQLGAVTMLSRTVPSNRVFLLFAVMLSPVVLSSLCRLNPSGCSFALICVFVCWYNSKNRVKRVVAACALGLATALKIVPCVWGVLYIAESPLSPREWNWRHILIASGIAFLFIFMPFALVGGFDAIPDFLRNAQSNAQYYSRDDPMWGFVNLVNRFCEQQYAPLLTDVAVWTTRAFAMMLVVLACFVKGAYRKCLFLGASMAFLTHHDYGGAYLLPAFFAWFCEREQVPSSAVCRLLEAIAWFLIVTPLQFPSIGEGTLNSALQGEALFLLLFLSVSGRYGRRTAESQREGVR